MLFEVCFIRHCDCELWKYFIKYIILYSAIKQKRFIAKSPAFRSYTLILSCEQVRVLNATMVELPLLFYYYFFHFCVLSLLQNGIVRKHRPYELEQYRAFASRSHFMDRKIDRIAATCERMGYVIAYLVTTLMRAPRSSSVGFVYIKK